MILRETKRFAGRTKAGNINNANSARLATGLSQTLFAERFGIPLGTIRDWEQGRTRPDATARALLKVIAAEPKVVQRALGNDPLQADIRMPEPGSFEAYIGQWSPEHDDDELADFQFRLMTTLIAQTMQDEFRNLCHLHGIGEIEARILFRLRRHHPAVRQEMLTQNMPASSKSISKKIVALERQRFVRRTISKKRIIVELTKSGEELVSKALAEKFNSYYLSANAFRLLSRSDRAHGLRFLRAILVAILTMQRSQKRPARRRRNPGNVGQLPVPS